MSESITRELMILVERVVRPLAVTLARRKRIRSEFLEQLQAIFAEVMDLQGNEQVALAATQARFGDPAEIAEELRRTVGWRDKMQLWFELFWAQDLAESVPQYVGRVMLRFILFVSTLLFLTMADHCLFGTETFRLSSITASVGVDGFLSFWLGSFLFFGICLGDELDQANRRWGKIVLYSLLLLAAWPLSLMTLPLTVGGTLTEFFVPWYGHVLGSMITLVSGAVIGVLHSQEIRYRREWAAFDLDAA